MLGESLRERFGERPEVPIRHEAIKLLASDTRLSILKQLDTRRMTVSELARALSLNKSTVHEHLAKLVEGGLIKRDESEEREFVYYELTKTAKYVLQPSSARFVLMMGTVVIAGLVAIVFAQALLGAGHSLAIHAEDTYAPAGEARLWDLDVTRAGALGAAPVEDARLYLLSPEGAAEYQRTGSLPSDARSLGAGDALAQPEPGKFQFRAALDPGVHYVLAVAQPGGGALVPLHAEPVRVTPSAPTVLPGIDPLLVEVAVQFHDAPVQGGTVQSFDAHGRDLGQVPVVAGKAQVPLTAPADEVRFLFKPAEPGSTFSPAEGTLRAPRAHVAFEPAQVPLLVTSEVQVIVDDPLIGPRGGAPVSVVRPDGRPLASAVTAADGSGQLSVQPTEPGQLIVKAGDLEIGRILVTPGLRLWVEPGPHWEGTGLRVRTLLLGREPEPVAGATLLLDGREVGTTDDLGWLNLQFGLGGRYQQEARHDGYVTAKTSLEVLPRTGSLAVSKAHASFAGASAPVADPLSSVQVGRARLPVGQSTPVTGFLVNPSDLPRVLRATLREDGRVIEAKAIAVPAGGTALVRFDYSPSQAGPHAVTINNLTSAHVDAASPVPPGALTAAKAVPGPWGVAPAAAIAVAALVAARRRGA